MTNRGIIGVNRSLYPKTGVVGGREHHLARLNGQRNNVGWLPTEESGLSLWLDAQDYETLSLSAGNIESWNDKSGNNNHATNQGDPPIYQATGLQGKPCMYTVGTEYLEHPIIGLSGDYSAFYVMRRDAGSTVGYWHTGKINQGAIGFFAGYQNHGWTIYRAPNFTSENISSMEDTIVLMGMITGRIFKNGEEVTYYSQNAITGGNITTLGTRADTKTLNMTGAIGEVIFYDKTVTNSVQKIIEGYLAHRWGITGNLPIGHPYKELQP